MILGTASASQSHNMNFGVHSQGDVRGFMAGLDSTVVDCSSSGGKAGPAHAVRSWQRDAVVRCGGGMWWWSSVVEVLVVRWHVRGPILFRGIGLRALTEVLQKEGVSKVFGNTRQSS